ncbi:hypothetical protein [Rubritepida flocculans]|jgi:hypothetical protein|uniref:hypothetical protein n=1 Tax=Rubritepida flocculans TaxID=182403 RepID=UPI000426C165|nr:hypothetical protein [Rubritepida flocculans]
MRLAGSPRPPRSCLDLARSPASALEIDALRAAAWHRHGVAALSVDDIADAWLRQAVTNEANRRWGRREGRHAHGR